MEAQIISAVEIASNPRDPSYQQAIEYINQLRQEPSAWRPCFSISTQEPPPSDLVRIFCLDVVNHAIEHGTVDQDAIGPIKDQLLVHLQKSYNQAGVMISPAIENKIAQIITSVFKVEYGTSWVSCFDDILALASTSQSQELNLKGTIFYLKFINSVHDEIGDQLLSRTRADQDQANSLKDLIRDRDVQKVATSWQTILSQWQTASDLVAELCLKAIGKWVSWVDISLVVNQSMLQLLYKQLERAQKVDLSDSEELARDAAVNVFTETVNKKMPSTDKLQIISFLNIDNIISQLSACPPLAEPSKSTYNVDLAETVAKLVNASVASIVRVLEAEAHNQQLWQKAEVLLRTFMPHLLRYFSDEYDEVCSTVIASMNDLLAFLQLSMKGDDAASQRAVMLLPILKAIFAKMRYDETSDWGQDDEETDEAEFQDLRKRLGVLQQSVAATDEQLYTSALTGVVHDTFASLRSNPAQLNWRDLDLALYEMYLFGDLAAKGGGLYRKNKPNSLAADKLIEMMQQMIDSGAGSFAHSAIQLQYMEICVRYSSFFEKQDQYIQPVLEAMLRFAHDSNKKVKLRSWYLLHRFIRQLRSHMGNAAPAVVQGLRDLLIVKAELPVEGDEHEMSSDDGSPMDATWDSQLYLFEAVGCICGAPSIPSNEQVHLIQAIIQPLMYDAQQQVSQAKGSQQQLVTLQIHHDIFALGNFARGYSDWIPSSATPGSSEPPTEAKKAFEAVSDVVLSTLSTLKSYRDIRTAANHAFSRLIGIVGAPMLAQLPRWVDGFMGESSTHEEMAEFLRLLGQVVYGFKKDTLNFLDTLFTPLLQRVFAAISTSPTGTDEEVALSDLKRDYLTFLIAILANEVSEVMVSNTNQPFFDTVINTIEHFCKDADDLPTAKAAFQVLNRMCVVWGGPDAVPASGQVNGNAPRPQPVLPGFDQFMMTRFSAVCWAMPTNPSFNPKDAQARQVLNEAAALQKTIYTKTGQAYLEWLRQNELNNMGMNDGMIDVYLNNLATFKLQDFRVYFAQLISQSRIR